MELAGLARSFPGRPGASARVAEPLAGGLRYRPGAGRSGFAALSGGAIEALPEWYMRGQPKPRSPRVAFTTWKHHTRESPLLESGLIGPVMLRSAVTKRF